MQKIYDVFISYRRKEADGSEQGTQIAKAIFSYLESKGLRVFLDMERMDNGPFPEQLRWQVTHAPNYIFIATEAAMKFRDLTPPDEDYVAEELRLALKLYDACPQDRVILPVIPRNVTVPNRSDGRYPSEIHRLFEHNAPRQLISDTPGEENLKDIYARVTRVNRGNLWNAGHRWMEQMTEEGRRFAGLDIDSRIMSLAGTERKKGTRLPIRAHLEDKPDAPLMEMIGNTPGHLYLIGEGGIGKTTALVSIMREAYGPGRDEADIDRMRLNGQVPLFVELSKAPDTYGRLYEGGRSTFIHRAIYQQIRQDLKAKQISGAVVEEIDKVFNMDPDMAVRPIHDLFTQKEGAPEYLLLLDGLNEVSRTEIKYKTKEGDGTEKTGKNAIVSMVLQEIRMLMEDCPNVRVILTSRSKEQTNWSDKTTMLYLSGVKKDVIEGYLRSRAVSEGRITAAKQNVKLQEILRIPLFLTMYAALEGEDEILTRGEILRLFFHQKKDNLYTAKARSEKIDEDVEKALYDKQPSRLTADMQGFILDFVLPEIAWRMVLDGEFYIRKKGKNGKEGLKQIILRVLTDRSETSVCGDNGKEAFAEYSRNSGKGSTRKIAKALCERLRGDEEDEEDAEDEIVSGILENAVFSLGVLQESSGAGGTEYGFIHHHFRDHFAAAHQINRLRLAAYLHAFGEDDLARECLADWQEHPLHSEVRRFIGEALGEAHNAPVCDERGYWHFAVPEGPCDRDLLRRTIDIYRGRFSGQNGYAVWNLLEILKAVRGDLCGEDLSCLDLTLFEANGCALGKKGLAAVLNNAKLNERLFMPGGHTGEVKSASYSPDGRRIVTASGDGTAIVWDTETLQKIGTLLGNEFEITSASYSPDGRRIVTASGDGAAKVWDAETLLEIGTLQELTDTVCSAAYSPDGRRIVTSSYDKTAKVWDAETLQEIGTLKLHTETVTSAVYSPDGRRIVTASEDGTAKVWDAETLQVIGILWGHVSGVKSAVYSPDGRRIVTSDGTAKVWDADMLQEIGMLERDNIFDRVDSVSYSPDGRRIVTVSHDKIAIAWDAETLREIGTLQGHTSSVNSASYSPDGRRIVTASWDKTAKVWDAQTLREIGTLQGHTAFVVSASYSPDGRRIVTTSWDETAKVWDAETLREFGTLKGHTAFVTSASYSPDGRRIVTVSYDNTAKVWDAETLQEIGTLQGHKFDTNFASYSSDRRRIVTISGNTILVVWDMEKLWEIWTLCRYIRGVISMAYSPDGRRIVMVLRDGIAKVWDKKTWQEIGTLKGHTDEVTIAVYSPDGRRIVTASYDRTAKVWDAETLREIGTLQGHANNVNSAMYSPDGCRIVTASTDMTAKVWNAKTLQEIGTLWGHKRGVKSASYSPDGCRIVTASLDNTAKVWDAETLQEIGTLQGHTNDVNSVTYSPDGRRIVTTSDDETAKVWDVETLREIGTLNRHERKANFAAYSSDGRRIVTASEDHTAKIWDAVTLREMGTLKGHTDGVNSASYSPDGRRIVTASNDKTAKVWDAEALLEIGTLGCRIPEDKMWDEEKWSENWTVQEQGHTDRVISAAYSPDGHRIVTASHDKTAKVWDAETLREIGTLKGHTEKIIFAMFSPDGHRIVTTSWDTTAKVWDAETLREIGTLKGHERWVKYAACSADGHRIVTASGRTAKVWDAKTLQEIGTLQVYISYDDVASVAYSPDGHRIVTTSLDGTAKVWDAGSFECLHTIHNIPGLEVLGVDLRHLHPDSRLSDEIKERLYEYGAIVDERG